MQSTPEKREKYLKLKRDCYNERLSEFTENKNEPVFIVEYDGHLYQKTDPIYLDPEHPLIKAHFYAPRKLFFGTYVSTFWSNIIVIWTSCFLLYIVLYFRLFKKTLDFLESLVYRLPSRKGSI
jgi:hypothetical protein